MNLPDRPNPKRRAGLATRPSRHWLPWLLKLLLTVLLLALLFRLADPAIFWTTIRSIDLGLLFVAVILFFPGQLLAAYRWYFLLKRLDRFLPFWSIARHTMLGQMSTFFLPGQISGDVVRTIAVARGQRGKTTLALSVMIDKAAFLAAMGAFALLGTWGSKHLSQFAGVRLAALGLLVAALSTVLLLSRFRSGQIAHRLVQLSDRLPAQVQPVLVRVAADREVPRLSLTTILIVLMLAFSLQLAQTIGSFVMAQAMHIAINPVDWAAINAAASVAQILPLTIGGLGVREGVFAAILALYAVPLAQATAFSLTGFVVVALLTAFGWLVLDTIYGRGLQAKQKIEGI